MPKTNILFTLFTERALARRGPQNVAIATFCDGPKSWAWPVSALSTLLLFLGIFAVSNALKGLHCAILQNELQAALDETKNLDDVLTNPRFASLLQSENKILRSVRSISGFLKSTDINAASSAFEKSGLGEKFELEAMENSLDNLENLSLSINENEIKQSALDREVEVFEVSYNILRKQVADYIGYAMPENSELLDKTDLAETAETGTDFPFYKEGLLANLPTLPEVPDKVSDVKQLSTIIGRPIDVLGANHKDIDNVLASMQQQADELKAMLSELSAKRQVLDETDKQLKNKRKIEKQLVQKELTQIVNSLAKPQLSYSTVISYSNLKKIGQQLGWEMPELRV